MAITSPENNQYINNRNVNFQVDAYDFEDGILAGNALVWYSDIDGELGTGKNITVDQLSIGQHVITCTGTDSDQNSTTASCTANLSFFNDDSYFPLPINAYWKYRYNNAGFSIIDSQEAEEDWVLLDYQVSIDEVNTRNCTMTYSVTKNNTTSYFRYYVEDYLETDDDNIYVTKTIQKLTIFKGDTMFDTPLEHMEIETVYSPRYLLIMNNLDIAALHSYRTSVLAETTYNYTNTGFGTKEYNEKTMVTTQYEIVYKPSIETDIGTFDAIQLTISQNDTRRVWLLAQGIGILRLEYDIVGETASASLYDTNISDFSGTGKMISPSSKSSGYRPAFTLSCPESSPERMLEISKLLRNLTF